VFFLYDGLGSTRALTDDTGSITDTYDYSAYGTEIDSTGITENSYRYTGEQFDANLNQIYLRARYYDPGVGRFTSQDTWMGVDRVPLSLNKFNYTEGDPVNNIDPTGNFLVSVSASSSIRVILSTIAVQIPRIGLSSAVRGAGSEIVRTAAASCVGIYITDLIFSKVSGEATGGGGASGACKPNKMRVQVQSNRLTYPFERGRSVLIGTPFRGVTGRQVRDKMLEYQADFSSISFAPSGSRSIFSSMIIEISRKIRIFEGAGTPNIFRPSIVDAQRTIGGKNFRIDVDNLNGSNLKSRN